MPPIVAVIAPGMMGSAVAKRMTQAVVDVLEVVHVEEEHPQQVILGARPLNGRIEQHKKFPEIWQASERIALGKLCEGLIERDDTLFALRQNSISGVQRQRRDTAAAFGRKTLAGIAHEYLAHGERRDVQEMSAVAPSSAAE